MEKNFTIEDWSLIVLEGTEVFSVKEFKKEYNEYSSIERVVLPKTLREVKSTFEGFNDLEEVMFASDGVLEKIPENCFKGLKRLERVTFPHSLKRIGREAFSETGLKKVEIVCDKLVLDNYCFSSTALKEASVTTLGELVIRVGVFNECSPLRLVVLESQSHKIDFSMAGYCFSKCHKLKEVKLNCDCNEIPVNLFEECCSLKDVKLADSITEISSFSFKDCESMVNLSLPSSVKSIESYAFNGSGIKELSYICDTLSLGSNCFSNSGLETVELTVLGDSLQIKAEAFKNCYDLKSVSIYAPDALIDNNSVTSLFEGCSSLNNVRLDCNLERIGPSMFLLCRSLKGIQIPSTVKAIDEFAFAFCESLEYLELPDSVEKIDSPNVFLDVPFDCVVSFMGVTVTLKEFCRVIDEASTNPSYRTLRDCFLVNYPEEFTVANSLNHGEAPEETNLF